MAYVFGFPREVTDLIYAMRDFRYEEVKKMRGTPTRLCFDTNYPELHDLLNPPAKSEFRPRVCAFPLYFQIATRKENFFYGKPVMMCDACHAMDQIHVFDFVGDKLIIRPFACDYEWDD